MTEEKRQILQDARIFSVNECHLYSGYSRGIIQYWLDTGLIPFEEIPKPGQKNRCLRIRKADLDDFLDSCLKKNGTIGVSRPKREPLILMNR